MLNTGIAWSTDKDVKFGNPANAPTGKSRLSSFIIIKLCVFE